MDSKGINITNYESYFLDLVEGTLSLDEREEVMAFLASHPELEKELMEFSDVRIIPENSTFSNRKSLKRQLINDENFEDFCIGDLEGTLTEYESNEFEAFLSGKTQLQNTRKLYNDTVFEADTTIVFQDKYLLKKRTTRENVIRVFWPALAVAAMLIVLLLVYWNTSVQETQKPILSDLTDQVLPEKSNTKLELQPKVTDSNYSDTQADLHRQKKVFPQIINTSKESENNLSQENNNHCDELQRIKTHPAQLIKQGNVKEPSIALHNPDNKQLSTEKTKRHIGQSNNKQFLSPKEVLAGLVKRNVFNKEDNQSSIGIRDIAELGIKGYSRLTGKKFELISEQDRLGTSNIIGVKSAKFEYIRSRKSSRL